MQNKNPEFIKNVIKSLEYCSLERASALLGCEMDDLKHYILIGAIGAFLRVKDIQLPIDLVFQGIESQELYQNAERLFEGELTFNKLRTILHGHEAEHSEIELSKIHIPMAYAVPDDIFEDTSSSLSPVFEVVASGVWKIDGELALESIFSGSEHTVVAIACDRQGKELIFETNDVNKCYWGNAICIDGVKINDLILIQHDLLLLFNSLYSGSVLDNMINSQRVRDDRAKAQALKPSGGKVHGNKILNSLRRQEVLEFAIYIKSKWPEKCKNAVQWAKLIDEKSPLKWSNGEPPLSTRKIEEMLREVVKDPVKIKST